MKKFLLIALFCVVAVSSAEASTKHHHKAKAPETGLTSAQGFGDRIGAHNSVMLCPNGVDDKSCHSIRNSTPVDYYIPSDKPSDRQAFLHAVQYGMIPGLSFEAH